MLPPLKEFQESREEVNLVSSLTNFYSDQLGQTVQLISRRKEWEFEWSASGLVPGNQGGASVSPISVCDEVGDSLH